MKRVWTEQELAERWTVSKAELSAVAHKGARGRPHFLRQLLFQGQYARFATDSREFAPAVMAHLRKQVTADASEASTGSSPITIERPRNSGDRGLGP